MVCVAHLAPMAAAVSLGKGATQPLPGAAAAATPTVVTGASTAANTAPGAAAALAIASCGATACVSIGCCSNSLLCQSISRSRSSGSSSMSSLGRCGVLVQNLFATPKAAMASDRVVASSAASGAAESSAAEGADARADGSSASKAVSVVADVFPGGALARPARAEPADGGVGSVASAAVNVAAELAGPYLPAARDYKNSPRVPIYVMLPLGVVTMDGILSDAPGLAADLRRLREEADVDGVMVDCWWGIVERDTPQTYHWEGYRRMFELIAAVGLKLQVVMSFHQCGGNVGDNVFIPLPQWVLDIGVDNPDIFFTDSNGNVNRECLSWGVDKQRVFRGRTALEVYYDFMRSFRQEFDDLFRAEIVEEVEVGLGPCGELRYPSYPESLGWKYPGIGEFVCYDKYLLQSLAKAAEARGHPYWGQPPGNTGSYNSRPHETGFFPDDGTYDGFYGRFFLQWYSNTLLEHGDRVLSLASLVFEGTRIACKVSGIHWWYKTASHAAELTAGFYNRHNRDGYAPLVQMVAKHGATLNFTCVELRTRHQEEEIPEAMADPEGLVWQVLNAAWEANVPVASENALPCFDRDGYEKILLNAKPRDDPDGHHLTAFTYLRLCDDLMSDRNWPEFVRFVRRLHGE